MGMTHCNAVLRFLPMPEPPLLRIPKVAFIIDTGRPCDQCALQHLSANYFLVIFYHRLIGTRDDALSFEESGAEREGMSLLVPGISQYSALSSQ